MKTANAILIKRLAAVKETPIAPDWVIRYFENGDTVDLSEKQFMELSTFEADQYPINEIRARVEQIAPAWPLESLLL